MGRIIAVFGLFFACFIISCGEKHSPLSSVGSSVLSSAGNSVSKDIQGLAKSVSSDAAMREFQQAYDEVMKILKDLKRYIQKAPGVDRHAEKVKGLAKDLSKALNRLGQAFKNVKNSGSAQAAMRSLASDIGSVMLRLKPYNLSYMFIINPCALPWIGEYLCKYAPNTPIKL